MFHGKGSLTKHEILLCDQCYFQNLKYKNGLYDPLTKNATLQYNTNTVNILAATNRICS